MLLDNATFASELTTRHLLPPSETSKLRTAYAPVAPISLTDNKNPVGGVLWAGRYEQQKMPLLAIEVARRMPAVEFHFFGNGSLESEMRRGLPPNATLHGRFSSLADVISLGFDGMLYTSLADGMPNVLVAAGAMGLPITASDVGGIADCHG